MALLGALGYNLDVESQDILIDAVDNKIPIIINDILLKHPNLLNLANTGNIDSARNAFDNIVALYIDSVDYLQYNEGADQLDDVLKLPDDFWREEPRYRAMLEELNTMQNTLIDPEVDVIGDEWYLNLGELFQYYKNARYFLPQFDDDSHIIPGSLSDPTFGDILPDKGS